MKGMEEKLLISIRKKQGSIYMNSEFLKTPLLADRNRLSYILLVHSSTVYIDMIKRG